MLTLFGQRADFCNGVPRRGFLKAGFLGTAGLTLTDVLRLQASTAFFLR